MDWSSTSATSTFSCTLRTVGGSRPWWVVIHVYLLLSPEIFPNKVVFILWEFRPSSLLCPRALSFLTITPSSVFETFHVVLSTHVWYVRHSLWLYSFS